MQQCDRATRRSAEAVRPAGWAVRVGSGVRHGRCAGAWGVQEGEGTEELEAAARLVRD